MSRMAVPTMDVVRFKEADVIVASTPKKFITLRQFNNGTIEDGKINQYSITDFVGILKLIEGQQRNILFQFGDNVVNADDLLDHEESEQLNNGDYEEIRSGDSVLWKWFRTHKE